MVCLLGLARAWRAFACAVCAFIPCASMAQGPSALFFLQNEERLLGDTMNLSTEHYSIDQFGIGSQPSEFVSVGRRNLATGGYAMHITRWNARNVPFQEAMYLPVGSQEMCAYSVDTMANGDLLIAGECRDVYSGTGMYNVFVCRMTRDLGFVSWCVLLKGNLLERPSVTSRELADGTIIVAHNYAVVPGGDLEPGLGLLTRLTAFGTLVWSREMGYPGALFGQIWFTDVRQDPQNPGSLWLAGSASTGFNRQAMLLNVALSDGCPIGEGGWLYPHTNPQYQDTWFSALAFDVRATGPSTIVASGGATDSSNGSIRPRIIDAPSSGGPANWDHLFQNGMSPAPTAISILRTPAVCRIVIAGVEEQPIPMNRRAQVLEVDGNAAGALRSSSVFIGSGTATSVFTDMCDARVKIGWRQPDFDGDGFITPFDPRQAYYVRDVPPCVVPRTGTDIGPGTVGFVFPTCVPRELIFDQILMELSPDSYDEVICRDSFPNGNSANRWP